MDAPASAIPLVSPVLSRGITTAIFPFSFPSHRPLKVERGRKKSDPIPERRVEKKKGERPTASHHRGEERLQGWFPHPWDGEGSVRLCQGLITSLAFPPCLGTPQPILSREIPGAGLSFGSAGGHKALPGSDSSPRADPGLCWCPHISGCVCLSAPEPTVEEKLQKLHSEIKFALKVDNPVSAWPGTSLLVLALL